MCLFVQSFTQQALDTSDVSIPVLRAGKRPHSVSGTPGPQAFSSHGVPRSAMVASAASVLVPPRLSALESDAFEFASCFFVYLLAV